MRVLAVDWSGAMERERRRIWLAEASPDGERLLRLEDGRSREELAEHLVEELPPGTEAVVGLDFAFGVPAWFAARLGARSGDELWACVAEQAEGWLAGCAPPFWGRPGRRRPELPAHFRLTEAAHASAKSVFQIGGAGAVGTGSLRGMPLLRVLRTAGFSIWPFHDEGWPRAVEIYPRHFTRPVRKSSAGARAAYLELFHPRLARAHVRLAASSEHAFDAAVAALGMSEALARGAGFPPAADAVERLEGAIWAPVAG
jgi:hypothetical protein